MEVISFVARLAPRILKTLIISVEHSCVEIRYLLSIADGNHKLIGLVSFTILMMISCFM